ncbi:DUF4141 domain-containing protein [Bacteroides sp. ET489]|uniref:DUF4141 domain-containing protein n=1 Tax=Mediterranea massiliensis TaxID=1841865 RepID=A0ABS2E0G3_9BACT|nr:MULTISPECIES: DUF4141 domain-containing protein [Bacteroidaceae]MBM6718946.1 DUF4141 domain-containing protein [Bacteroides gallinaceum]MBM6735113.1 DUF4141 domain-containing protein [Mediterranea massiliensis]MDO3391217.1 DUF4141 domain-containing protein [Bacteroides sp. ET489]
MNKRITAICLTVLLCTATTVRAQWVTFDPSNLAQSIVNTTRNVIQTTTTAENMVKNFQETVKIYEQGKKYYDALKSVHNLVKDARKVQQTVLLVGEISDIYVNSFQKMLADENYTTDELAAIASGYTKMLEESSGMLDELKTVVTQTGLSMTDKERMDLIDRIYRDVKNHRNLVRYYTNRNIGVSYLRAKEKNDTRRVLDLYGTDNQRYW